MAEKSKELRKMSRTELIEIIYAMQQNEKTLYARIDELQRQLDDRILRMEKAGSIAEAALSLNRIFEDADRAAKQYLESVRVACDPVAKAENEELQHAKEEVDEFMEQMFMDEDGQ